MAKPVIYQTIGSNRKNCLLKFNLMFEKATAFSAIFIFIVFGIVGIKYLDFLESKNQATKTSLHQSINRNINIIWRANS